MKNLLYGLLIALVMVGVYLAWVLPREFKAQRDEVAYWRNKAFKTDTVYSNTQYKETRVIPSNAEKIPPGQTVIYKNEVPTAFLLKLEAKLIKIVDSLNRKDTITISPNFLTLYPKASKFLGGSFLRDTVSFDLLDIAGNIYTNKYPVDFGRFKYYYKDNQMNAKEIKTSLFKKGTKDKFIRYNGTYLNYNYDLLGANHFIRAESTFDIWKIRAGGFLQNPIIPSLNSKNLQGGATVGFKLF